MARTVVVEYDDGEEIKIRHRCCTKPGRLNLMIDPELKEWAHAYASRKHTTLTAILTAHLVDIRDNEYPTGCPVKKQPGVDKEEIKAAVREAIKEIFDEED